MDITVISPISSVGQSAGLLNHNDGRGIQWSRVRVTHRVKKFLATVASLF